MTGSERLALLRVARAAVEDDLGEAGALDRALAGIARTPALEDARATFVTLRIDLGTPAGPELRGCIGTMEPVGPVLDSVVRNARRAAFEDPRFPPVTHGEMDAITFHVSVLSPRVEVGGPDDIVVGRDGVELELGPLRAVFLPEVAEEHGWTTPKLLDQLARKAGIPGGDWHGARLWTFRSESFGEPTA